MSLRLVQICLPGNKSSELEEMLEDQNLLGTSHAISKDDTAVWQAVVSAEKAEPLLDKIEERFSEVEGFRVLLLSVEATIPRLNKKEKSEQEPEAGANGGRVSREELYEDASEGASASLMFVALILLSTVVAAIGLMQNDVAVIIGAMVIAPLLSPNVALALASTLGDGELARNAVLTICIGIAATIALSIGMGILLNVDTSNPAIASRTYIKVADVILALAAGAAGTFAFSRGLSGPLIGVMVAVALMPPLVTLGLLIGSGNFDLALGASLVVIANLVCINLAGVAAFLIQGVRPRSWWEVERATRHSRWAIAIWGILLICLVALLIIAPPTKP